MYLKGNWIQLFRLLCSLPRPSFWRGTDRLRARSSVAFTQRYETCCYSQGLWPRGGWVFVDKSSPRHFKCCYIWQRPSLLNPCLACTRKSPGQGLRESSFCPCPPSLPRASASYTSQVQETACCRWPWIFMQVSPLPGVAIAQAVHLSHRVSAQGHLPHYWPLQKTWSFF